MQLAGRWFPLVQLDVVVIAVHVHNNSDSKLYVWDLVSSSWPIGVSKPEEIDGVERGVVLLLVTRENLHRYTNSWAQQHGCKGKWAPIFKGRRALDAICFTRVECEQGGPEQYISTQTHLFRSRKEWAPQKSLTMSTTWTWCGMRHMCTCVCYALRKRRK